MSEESKKQYFMDCIHDCGIDLLYYDRKESDLTREDISELLDSGEVTLEEILEQFKKGILDVYDFE